MDSDDCTIIIPARLQSSRFPNKLLAQIRGQSIVRHTLQQAKKSEFADRIIVATDSDVIAAHLEDESVEVVKTSGLYICGTDRCAELIDRFRIGGIVINLQADELFIKPTQLDQLFALLSSGGGIKLASLMSPLPDDGKSDPNTVKVFCDEEGLALDFVRTMSGLPSHQCYRHLGVYGFLSSTLSQLAGLPPTKNELERRLEQMRWMDHGIKIRMLSVEQSGPSINVPEDLARAERFLSEKKS